MYSDAFGEPSVLQQRPYSYGSMVTRSGGGVVLQPKYESTGRPWVRTLYLGCVMCIRARFECVRSFCSSKRVLRPLFQLPVHHQIKLTPRYYHYPYTVRLNLHQGTTKELQYVIRALLEAVIGERLLPATHAILQWGRYRMFIRPLSNN